MKFKWMQRMLSIACAVVMMISAVQTSVLAAGESVSMTTSNQDKSVSVSESDAAAADESQVDASEEETQGTEMPVVEELPDTQEQKSADVQIPEGWTTYNQNLSEEGNSIADAATVKVGNAWGMDGNALNITTSGDVRIKFNEFKAMNEGSYELAFKTGTDGINSLGFLVRYQDEANYTGLSIDKNTWTLHYSKGLSARGNTPFSTKGPELKANTVYKVKIDYSGADVTVSYMEQGNSDWTSLGTQTMAGDYSTQEGTFAVRLYGGGKQGITIDNVVQYDANGTETARMDFNDLQTAPDQYEARANKNNTVNNKLATLALQTLPASETVPGFADGTASKITTAGIHLDSASPVAKQGIYTVQLNGMQANQYGMVFRYKDENNYATIQYDGSQWIAGGKVNGTPVSIDLPQDLPALQADQSYICTLDYSQDGAYTMTVKDVANQTESVVNLGALEGICTEKGQVGLISGEGVTLYASPVSVAFPMEAAEVPDPTEHYITLQSDEMQVLVGDSFPHIYTYKNADGSKKLAYGVYPGQENTGMTVYTKINEQGKLDTSSAVTCTTTSEKTASDATSATYSITATGVDVNVTFEVKLSVTGKTLRMVVQNVTENSGSTVRAFAFADLPMVSMYGMGAGAAMSRVNSWGPASDIFVQNNGATGNNTYDNVTYALLYDQVGESVAAVENNAENGANKYVLTQTTGQIPALKLTNTAWAWQYHDTIAPEKEDLPYAEVVIGGDENKDGKTTWQDAGIAYRTIMRKPYGYEDVKNEWMFIAMNMSSQTSQPFLRVLDTAKAFSYQTDGFGMKIMNKGYQAAGHDDSHGDYAFIGEQQGGVEDFNTLINEGLKYGIKNGVHLNMTEFALDSRAATPQNLKGYGTTGLVPNWNWFDQAYLINKYADVDNGGLKNRLDAFKAAVPNLDFIYVDVYQSGSTYDATQAMKYMNDNGWTVGTEALGDFNQGITFVHWNTDLYYACGGTQSQVMRFVTNSVGDLSAPDRALLGAMMPGVADWRNTNIFNDAQTTFYRGNLPTKYLQYFDLLEWTPNESATFSNGVKSQVSQENDKTYTTITKDGKTIAKIDTTNISLFEDYKNQNPQRPSSAEIFIPWSPVVEDKIYCYSDKGGEQTWQVPDSWNGVSTAYLYTLTNSGRTNMQEVSVSNGSITLNLTAGQPYILVKEKAEQAHLYNSDGTATDQLIPAATGADQWGQGSVIKNFGFTGATMDGWTKTATQGSADEITIDTTFTGNASGTTTQGDPRVKFDSTVTGSISQQMQVEPGKTYSFSVWVNSESERPMTLSVSSGNNTQSTTLDTTQGIPVKMKPSKYTGKDYQRMKVDIVIPQGVQTATLTFSVQAGEQPVYVDDFRAWEWEDGAQPNPLTERYYYYEDFEHLDENWGPFVSDVNTQPYTNLAYKLEDGSQMKWYTVDTLNANGQPDTNNKTSLKTADFASGSLMRTLPSTLNFETGTTYTVAFDYQSYREIRSGNKDVNGNDIGQQYYGYNYLLQQPAYQVTVHKADGTVVQSYPIEPSTFAEGTDIAKFDYNSRPSTETVSFKVDATSEEGLYVTIDYINADPNVADNAPILSIDNFRVTDDNATLPTEQPTTQPSAQPTNVPTAQPTSTPAVQTGEQSGAQPTQAPQTGTATPQTGDNGIALIVDIVSVALIGFVSLTLWQHFRRKDKTAR